MSADRRFFSLSLRGTSEERAGERGPSMLTGGADCKNARRPPQPSPPADSPRYAPVAAGEERESALRSLPKS